jgi:predicted anti-sigma-YlaC factor YlaD
MAGPQLLNAFRPSDCERARAAASAQLDGELPELEAAFLEAHASWCESCARFASEIAVLTGLVRWAELEQPAGTVVLPRPRRRATVPLRALAAVSVAAAVCVAVLTNLQNLQPAATVGATYATPALRPAVADPPLRQPLASVTPFMDTDASASSSLAPRVEL